MKISEAARKIKVPIKKIRYYSDIGLIRPAELTMAIGILQKMT